MGHSLVVFFFFFSFPVHVRGRKGRKKSGGVKNFSGIAKAKISVTIACIARVRTYKLSQRRSVIRNILI